MKYFKVLLIVLQLFARVFGRNVVCYWQQRIDISLIDPFICTHIVLAFVDTNSTTGELFVASTQQHERKIFHSMFFNNVDVVLKKFHDIYLPGLVKLVELKQQNRKLKTMIAVANNFPVIASSLRAEFAISLTNFLEAYDLDGVDIDWEFPAVSDTNNFILLLKDVKSALRPYNKILSVAVNTCASDLVGYDVKRIYEEVDFVNAMLYNFHSGSWQNSTANHGNYCHPASSYNVISCMNKWISKGLVFERTIIGIPAYSQNFQLDDPEVNGIGAPASFKNFGKPGEIPATYSYNIICKYILENGWTRRYETKTSTGPHAFYGSTWAGYDDVQSIREKAEMVKNVNYGGLMFWSLDHDDHSDFCGDGKFPLIGSVKSIIK